MIRAVSDGSTSNSRIRVATYNIHRGRGLDGRQRLDRIVDVLREIDADLVALQEVFATQALALAEATGMHAAFGPIRRLRESPYGNLCLSRFPLVGHARYNLTCRPFEPRGCLRVDVDLRSVGGSRVHVFNVHLGLHYQERIRQARALTRIVGLQPPGGPRLLLGDFNEWFHGHASRVLRLAFGHPNGRHRGVCTHPSPLPVFPLDRIYHDGRLRLLSMRVHTSRLARVASDHLPAYADLGLASANGAHGSGT
jgi:endonuclease/exonuclease/phosphatase family metal-dependent hydrolase